MRASAKLAFILIVFTGVVILLVGVFLSRQAGFSARKEPSSMEAFVARKLRQRSVPQKAKEAKNPFTPTPEILKDARALILSLTLCASVVLMAHEGKVHVAGTITAVDDQHIEVKSKDGQTKSIRLNEKTTFHRNKEKVERGNLKVGRRVVVHATPVKNGDLIADEVHLGVVKPASGHSKKGTHDHKI